MNNHILIIEDDAFLGDMLLKKLQQAGYEATLIADGKEGYDAIVDAKPDLILLDIMLPSKEGYQILEEKKDNASIADIPVIIISNSGQPVEISRVVELGVKDYIVKAQVDPAEIVQKVKEQLETPEVGALTGKKVLFIEDDKFLTDLLGMKLAQEKIHVTHASTGKEGIDQALATQPDIILLDLVIPEMDGFAVLEALKKDETTKHIPVIVLSNLGQEEDIKRVKELGAKEFFVKAMLTPQQIIGEIKKALE